MCVSWVERVYRDKGQREGKLKNKLEITRKMKAMNLPLDVIAKATDLSETEINMLN